MVTPGVGFVTDAALRSCVAHLRAGPQLKALCMLHPHPDTCSTAGKSGAAAALERCAGEPAAAEGGAGDQGEGARPAGLACTAAYRDPRAAEDQVTC